MLVHSFHIIFSNNKFLISSPSQIRMAGKIFTDPKNYFKNMYFLLKWVYVETIPNGETLPMNAISQLYSHGDNDNIWLNDFLDCYLNEDDCILCSTLLAQGFKLWIKCTHEPQL